MVTIYLKTYDPCPPGEKYNTEHNLGRSLSWSRAFMNFTIYPQIQTPSTPGLKRPGGENLFLKTIPTSILTSAIAPVWWPAVFLPVLLALILKKSKILNLPFCGRL